MRRSCMELPRCLGHVALGFTESAMCCKMRARKEKSFTLGIERVLALLVLGDFVRLVLLALLAVSPAGFRDVHLQDKPKR